MTPESDNFETRLHALADQSRAAQDKQMTAAQQSDIARGQARRAVEMARERRELNRELEWL